MPSLKELREGQVAEEYDSDEEAARASASPSVYQTTCDLIDATGHEILLLEGTAPEAVASFESYAVLAQKFNFYLGQLVNLASSNGEEVEEEKEEEPLIKDHGIRCRYVMTTLVIELCSRRAYPGENEEEKKFPALTQVGADWWKENREMLRKLQQLLPAKGDENVDHIFESLYCQLGAMESLTTLRGQLEEVAAELEGGQGDKRPQPHVNRVKDDLDAYRATCGDIEGKLEANPEASACAEWFVPSQMLSMKRCTTIGRVRDSVRSLLGGIEDLIDKEAFPLRDLQVQFLASVRGWEKTHLPLPTLFQVGYFGDAPAPGDKKAPKTAKRARAKDDGADDEEHTPVVKKTKVLKKGGNDPKKGPGRAKKPAKKSYESDSVDSWMESPPEADPPATKRISPKKPKKTRRRPYTYEEKEALLKGVAKFGTGAWREILNYYEDVFEKNQRNNVNLKDLYRTLEGKNIFSPADLRQSVVRKTPVAESP